MGLHGPIPKRSDQRHGHRAKAEAEKVTRLPAARRVPVPRADPGWHPVAARWFRSLARSGQAQFYEPSDWAVAFLIAESMSRDLLPQVVGVIQEGRDAGQVVRASIPLKGASLGAYLRAFGVLLVSEGDRRRAQVELQRGPKSDANADRAQATVTDLRARLTTGDSK